MANATGITVAVERAIHDEVAKLAQRIFDEHGITLTRVHVDWLDISSIARRSAAVKAVHIESSTTLD